MMVVMIPPVWKGKLAFPSLKTSCPNLPMLIMLHSSYTPVAC